MDAANRDGTSPPPPFLGLAGHRLRWRLMGELARSDRRVGELCALTGERQSLVSYHLRRLRDGGVVSARRSHADGRDTYYVLELGRCGELLADAGAALHPGLATDAPPRGGPAGGAAPRGGPRVLYLCTGHSARSRMAEAFTTSLSGGAVRAASAGSHPRPVHPHAVRVMRARGIDLDGPSTHVSAVAHRRFDHVVTLCDRVREVCPPFPGAAGPIHWSVPDPARDGTAAAFARAAEEIETRVGFLLAAIRRTTDPREVMGHA